MRIRPARAGDRDFILDLAPRLVEFGRVSGRDPSQMAERDRAVLANALEQRSADSVLFVAEDDLGNRVGFLHLTTADDYYSDSVTAHIADVVVTAEAEGQRVGTALLAYAEQWALERGFRMMTLNVFTANQRARHLYLRFGFQEEWIRCVKRLG